jgi:hypothetical protein
LNGTITKHRKKNGRISWGYYYRAEGRQYTKCGFATKFEASKALGAAVGKHSDGDGAARRGDSRTMAEYIRYWLDNHAALRRQPKTFERYGQLAEYLVRLLGHISIRDLRPGVIQDAVNWLQVRGGEPTKAHPQGRPLAAKTVYSISSLLFTCLRDAARLEHIPGIPMADRKVKLPRLAKPSPAVMDAEPREVLGSIHSSSCGLFRLPPRRIAGVGVDGSGFPNGLDDGFEECRTNASGAAGQVHEIRQAAQHWPR